MENKDLVLINNFVNTKSLLAKLLVVLSGAFAIGMSAQLYIPIQPVPITLQSFAVLMVGATLGRQLGSFATIAYLILGIVGLPFFAGGASGASVLMAPSFGYIIGFIAASFIAGLASEQIRKANINKLNFLKYLAYLAVAHQLIFVFGVAWLAVALNSFSDAIKYGYLPFMGVDALKFVFAAAIIATTWKAVDSHKTKN